ncbi:hypothetical protein, partial [Paraburkholderia terricola]|uniref:hypothetical protein n=1 Tax=Paraburkholderia terricola TaxID=169427 RepID=UPI001F47F31A
MNELLATVPDDKPIPLATRDRLYELSWAIAFSGESAKDHEAPVIRLMGRHVQSAAPPFGVVSLHLSRPFQDVVAAAKYKCRVFRVKRSVFHRLLIT